MDTLDLEVAVAGLSTRLMAMETLVHALVEHAVIDRHAALAWYDQATEAIHAHAEPTTGAVRAMLAQSFADFRTVLQGPEHAETAGVKLGTITERAPPQVCCG